MRSQVKAAFDRERPGRLVEDAARAIVRNRFPAAASSYTDDGAVVIDAVTGHELGSAVAGDWAVEFAWLSAAESIAAA
ncbi:hypothetical protein BLA39750_01132 [Burkholderia lata]|uniref:Uncharacterized protein n=1 Tax=Burkholderia lata (strain ATCC 17760 / DSM 23089 / LMG 22485 / NCIMB 9086 / R18194 / 383) TaxID=482957 RepID=A0A6P2V226_BURL3|nr:hypothetical protein BLA39750_01132 [Burkholderia lata]